MSSWVDRQIGFTETNDEALTELIETTAYFYRQDIKEPELSKNFTRRRVIMKLNSIIYAIKKLQRME